MESIIEKTLKEIEQAEERATVVPTIPNAKYSTLNSSPKQTGDVEIQVDTSDEKNESEEARNENSDIFSMFNQSTEVNSLKIEVEIDDDIVESDDEENTSDAFAESGGKDTVMGQGTNPKPEDETYLSLLKHSTPTPKVKIKINK